MFESWILYYIYASLGKPIQHGAYVGQSVLSTIISMVTAITSSMASSLIVWGRINITD